MRDGINDNEVAVPLVDQLLGRAEDLFSAGGLDEGHSALVTSGESSRWRGHCMAPAPEMQPRTPKTMNQDTSCPNSVARTSFRESPLELPRQSGGF